jgi:Ca-activated chloride channel family protein
MKRTVERRLVLALVPLIWLLTGACLAEGGAGERLNQEGNRAYVAGNYQEALELYRRAAAERPDLRAIAYNTGNALHRLRQFERAVPEAQRAAADGPNDVRFRAYYALGNHFARLNRWREAYEAYRNALILAPTDLDAKVNLEIALRRLEEQRQGQQGQAAQRGQQGQPGEQGQSGQPSGQAGAQPGQQQGSADQSPSGQAGQQQGQRSGQQGPTQPQPGGPGGREAASRELRDALAQFERTISPEDALRILDLIAEQQRAQRAQPPSAPSGIKDQ